MNKFLTFTILYLVIALTACKKEWLDTSPTDQVDQSVIISTTQNAMVALNGIHRIMWTQYFNQDEAGEGSIHIYMDNLGEDLLNNSSASNTFYQAVYRWDAHRNVNSSVPYFVWFFYYRYIQDKRKRRYPYHRPKQCTLPLCRKFYSRLLWWFEFFHQL